MGSINITGREDNGSLPLDILPIDNALMSWGMCDTAFAHIGFWLDNYIAADGHVVFFSGDWIAHPDSISDLGRVIDMFLNAVRMCDAPAAWQARHLPTVSSIGEMLLRLRSQAPKLRNATSPPVKPERCDYGPEKTMMFLRGNSKGGSAPTLAAAKLKCNAALDCGGITQQYGRYNCRQSSTPAPAPAAQPSNSWPILNAAACGHTAPSAEAGPATAGLIIGAPEHDFSSDKTHFYYNNNVWSLYAMEEFGKFLTSADDDDHAAAIGKNVSLGKKTRSFAPFSTKSRTCAKTGSGKHRGNTDLKGVFSQAKHCSRTLRSSESTLRARSRRALSTQRMGGRSFLCTASSTQPHRLTCMWTPPRATVRESASLSVYLPLCIKRACCCCVGCAV